MNITAPNPELHKRAILELPLKVLVREALLGMDLETIQRRGEGGYSITIPYGPHSLIEGQESCFWGSAKGDALLAEIE